MDLGVTTGSRLGKTILKERSSIAGVWVRRLEACEGTIKLANARYFRYGFHKTFPLWVTARSFT